MFATLIFCFAVINCVLCVSQPSSPCRREDNACLTILGQQVYSSAFQGEIGQEIDPLFQERIDGNLPTLKFSLTDSTTTGFKSCQIRNTSIASDKSFIDVEMFCPKFEMNGQYEADGTIDQVPFQGSGGFSLHATEYTVFIHTNLKASIRDGKRYIRVVDFDVDALLKGDLDLKLQNLFNGNKELSEATHKFIKENPEFIAKFLQKPVFTANLNKVVEVANKFLETVSVDGLID